jgi:CubicO group peptidase (beta-lactamase class C family)
MSIVKSMLSALFGAAIKSGHIRSIDDPITQYAPQLAGRAYDEVTVRNLLQIVWSALPKPTGKAVVRDYDVFAAVSAALR